MGADQNASSTDYNEFLHPKERERERTSDMLKRKSRDEEAKLLVACARLQPERMIGRSQKKMVGECMAVYMQGTGSRNHLSHHGTTMSRHSCF